MKSARAVHHISMIDAIGYPSDHKRMKTNRKRDRINFISRYSDSWLSLYEEEMGHKTLLHLHVK